MRSFMLNRLLLSTEKKNVEIRKGSVCKRYVETHTKMYYLHILLRLDFYLWINLTFTLEYWSDYHY